MIRMLVVSVLVLLGATDLRAQEDRSCKSHTQEVGAKALAVFEEEHDLTIVAGDYKTCRGGGCGWDLRSDDGQSLGREDRD